MNTMGNYQYCMLPGGNVIDFPMIDAQLVELKVSGEYKALESNGRIYRIPGNQLSRLPLMAGVGCVLGYMRDGKYHDGFAVYPIPDVVLEHFLHAFAIGEWLPVVVLEREQ